eukprot:15388114-Alexandrium_andersonii.AAC.1
MPPRQCQAERAGALPRSRVPHRGRELDDAASWAGAAAEEHTDRAEMPRPRGAHPRGARGG